MAGGVGQRFWPLSRRSRPKQLIDLTGEGAMIALTVKRLERLSRPDETLVVTVAGQQEAIARALTGLVPPENIIAEPVGRNTAPSVGLAAVSVRKRFGDEPFAILPADHLVGDTDRFEAAMRAALVHARGNDCLLTFGIRPTRPETGYGYVKSGKVVARVDGAEIRTVERFLEKPSPEDASRFVEDGTYFWNSGMFCWRPSVVLDAIAAHLPELSEVLEKLEKGAGTGDDAAVLNEVYPSAPRISIDHGVMERADNVVVLPVDFAWNDVGSWESIRDVHAADAKGNVLIGDHVMIESSNNIVFSPKRMVGVIGMSDVVVVDSEDAVLVCSRKDVQKVRKIVDALKRDGRDDLL